MKLAVVKKRLSKQVLIEAHRVHVAAVDHVVVNLNVRLRRVEHVRSVGVVSFTGKQVRTDFLHHATVGHHAGFKRLEFVREAVGIVERKADSVDQHVGELVP